MNLTQIFLLFLLPLAGISHAADWMDLRKTDDMAPHPAHNSTTMQTPPDFRWPYQDNAARYEMQVSSAMGETTSHTSSHNWLSPNSSYPPGEYRWRARALMTDGVELAGWSDWRRFVVADTARTFVLPPAAELNARIAGSPHPRAFPKEGELAALEEKFAGVRAKDWIKIQQRVRRAMGTPLPDEPSGSLDSIQDKQVWAAALQELPNRVRPALTLTVEAALAWRMTGDPAFLAEAKRRALALAKWNPAGVTSWKSQDQMTREFGYVLALSYDWLYPDLAPDERTALANAAMQRLKDIDVHIDGPAHSLARRPVDSHGWTALSVAAAISSLLAGDVPDADRLAAKFIPWYYNSISPWGGEDGGHANGTAYAVWTFSDTAIVWDILRRTVGLDPAGKPWSRGMVEFLTYMLPPGAPQNVFGDAAEWAPVIQIAKRFLRRVDHPLARWYERQTFGEDGSEIWLLTAPYDAGSESQLPPGTDNSGYFPSVGMAAMHGDLSMRNRMSVYFKSSPYGSYNHSHADQNSFVIHAHGKPVLMSSGHYDYYGSPHWSGWYKQTAAHNAITFDGGKGQNINGRDASGNVVQFYASAGISGITGDAAAAWGGKLQTALRTLIYIRPDTVLVIDRLKSSQPRRWEWNLHAVEKFRSRGASRISVMEGESERMCVDMLEPMNTLFSQESGYPVAPSNGKPAWWHGVFSLPHPSRDAVFIAQLSLDCQRMETTVEDLGKAGLKIKAGEHRITIEPSGRFALN